jgi:iron only hydrogenase large subunit-like protein
MLLKPPLDITALYCRKELTDQGIDPAEIGVFYITPCAAKIAAIKSPVGEEFSMISGVINMDTLYNIVSKIIRSKKNTQEIVTTKKSISERAMLWTLTQGESSQIKGRCLAVDGIHNVTEFLEKIENEEIENLDFLELRACDESCAGGVLLHENRFLVAERLRGYHSDNQIVEPKDEGILKYKEYLERRIRIQNIHPRSMLKLDDNLEEAMFKMDKANNILKSLSLTDCGACGSPNCQAFANDIALGEADIRQCIFIQKNREQTGELSGEQSLELMKTVWGIEKFT